MLTFIIFFPFIGSFLTKIFKRKNLHIAIGVSLLNFILLIYNALKYKFEFTFKNPYFPFFSDSLSYIFAITSNFIALLIFIYSIDYFEDEKKKGFFSFWGLVFLGSMLGVVFSNNLISLYMFWEIAGICSYRLIGTYREKEHLLKADKALMITTGGAGIMFLAFAYIYSQTGTFYFSEMNNFAFGPFVFLVFFIGVITKSATFPLHAWLPDASIAPTPVTAFLHAAVLVKIGIYGLLRIFWKTLIVEGDINFTLYLCIFSSLITGIVALIENDIKKILAYSTISQLGFILAGILTFNNISILGVLIFYIAHALGKAGLFLTAGFMEKIFGTKDITKMGGIMNKLPLLTIGFLFSMFSIIGIPPFLGFFGKIEIIIGFLFNQDFLLGFLLIFSSILTLLYMWRIFSYVFIGKNEAIIINTEGLNFMSFSIITCGILSFFLGVTYIFLKGGLFGY